MKNIKIFFLLSISISPIALKSYLNPQKLIKEGEECYKNGNYIKALRKFEKAIQINKNLKEGYINLAKVYMVTKNYLKAIEMLNIALKLDPKDVNIYKYLGKVYLKMGLFNKAEKLFIKVLKKNPYDYDAHIDLALIYYNKGKTNWAIDKLKYVIRSNPSNIKALIYLGKFLYEKGKKKEAEWCFNRAKKIDPQNPLLRAYEGNILLKKYQLHKDKDLLEKAIFNLNLAIKRYPANDDIIKNLIYAYILQKDYTNALKVLENLKRFSKNQYEFLFLKGFIILKKYQESKKLKDLNSSIELFYKALSQKPTYPLIRCFLENLVIEKQRGIMSEIRVSLSNYRYKLGVLFLKNYRLSLGFFNLLRARELNPINPKILYKIANIYRMNNFFYSYLETLKDLTKLSPNNLDFHDMLEIAISKKEEHLFDKYALSLKDYMKGKPRLCIARFSSQRIFPNLINIGAECLPKMLKMLLQKSKKLETMYISSTFQKLYLSQQENCDYIISGKYNIQGETIIINIKVLKNKTKNLVLDKNYEYYGKSSIIKIAARFINDLNKIMPKAGEIVRIDEENIILNLGLRDGISTNGFFLIKDKDSRISNKKIIISKVEEFFSKGELKNKLLSLYISEGTKVIYKKEKKEKKK